MKPTPPITGFTLIELLVVIAIIATLSSVILTVVFNARKESRDTARVTIAEQLSLGIRLYKEAEGAYPSYPTGTALGVGGTLDTALAPYLSTIPQDPLGSGAETDGFGFEYISGVSCAGKTKALVVVRALEADTIGNAQAVCGIPDDGRYLVPVH